MKITRQLLKIILFVYILIRFRSVKLAYSLSFYNIALSNLSLITLEGNFVNFINTSNKVAINLLPNFNFSINQLFAILNSDLAKVNESYENYFLVTVNGIRFKVASLSNMAVVYEVFIQRIYEVALSTDKLVVIDIGMNVGVASLNFANMKTVEHVYGYEPFPDTFKESLFNISLNPILSAKIRPFNQGVSDTSCKKSISLFDSGLLSASTIESIDNYGKVANKKIEVQLISIIDVLNKVTSVHPNNRILLKIDCEGEEYAIFDAIKNTKYLDQVDCILLEWHEKGFEQLASILLSSGFQYFHMPNEKHNSGMLYAFRKN
jgi:FkbM family methyltransferase